MDPLGQGVSKKEKITFIEKTLPGEKGQTTIYKEVKGVSFGFISNEDDLKIKSNDRIRPECPHYWKCPGCQYLHTNYKNEISFKRKSLERHILPLTKTLPTPPEVKIHSAMRRFQYRNRVQLHYDLTKKKLGLKNTKLKEIIEIPNCKILNPKAENELKALYNNKKWVEVVQKNNPSPHLKKGHIEIYNKGKDTQSVAINQPYAHLGFSQVFEEMNLKLKDFLTQKTESLLGNSNQHVILDLFGGNGNLTRQFKSPVIVIDNCQLNENILSQYQTFHKRNLYQKNILKDLIQLTKSKKVEGLIVDPPRAGIKGLDKWTEHFKPNFLFFISCNPSVLKRDLAPIIKLGYKLNEIHLFDLFPSTQHYETIVLLTKVNLS